ncbi:hypothetical protein [Acidipropionibacterium jensenii]|uniref:hypothetical protein n=1 Tax=Acidipropionibacterium jensenii TaxID=1749 RepID=UPI002648F9EB|nr:hypothetical protein [Acidipropionibacterium jensenii]MDN6556369.1 hypothetical protein [Acidipropionibacterium acidipropionici]MDN5977986.1 hypothetical protein [Acidipropionibacterium jensenii]MDN5996790.1 hypothetical protein [Acidipropionibacterium jensenii]MDN6427413.1 hypothetical protein [Acidipropionibacterium jensenii]MDN6440700.1 hypothetical protein [Acidipropionibacterium jensenii]
MASTDETRWRQDIAVDQIRQALAERDRNVCTDAEMLADIRSIIDGLERFAAMPDESFNDPFNEPSDDDSHPFF